MVRTFAENATRLTHGQLRSGVIEPFLIAEIRVWMLGKCRGSRKVVAPSNAPIEPTSSAAT